jgi:serine/threonine-protein kinase HipA
MDREVHVHADLNGTPQLVGRMYAHVRGRRETATFEYDAAWLDHDERYALEPALQLGPGPFQVGADKQLFGSLGDSAPDRWGRMLMRRAERRRAAAAGTAPRTLFEIDYLLEVNDETRQGALRFADRPGGPFLAQGGTPVPPLVDLPRLLSAVDRIADENEDDEDLRLLIAPGSSLGGARPKASVREPGGRLAIAKFPHKDDEWNTVLWEGLSLALADKAGISVTSWRPERIAGKDVILLARFDRDGAARIPFLSAMSMIGAKDNETHSYLEIADALRRYGARPTEDLRQLWRRIVFTVLISNVDDHMRNHGFLYRGTEGWTLSPAYDLNPMPVDVKPRVLSTAIDEEDQTASLELALSVAEYFEIDERQARAIAGEVGEVVARWREEATALGIGKAECDRMESAFVHADLELACAFGGSEI